MGVSQNYGYLFGVPNNKDYSILGSILGSPYLGKLLNNFGFDFEVCLRYPIPRLCQGSRTVIWVMISTAAVHNLHRPT